jgi:hypothetical protein
VVKWKVKFERERALWASSPAHTLITQYSVNPEESCAFVIEYLDKVLTSWEKNFREWTMLPLTAAALLSDDGLSVARQFVRAGDLQREAWKETKVSESVGNVYVHNIAANHMKVVRSVGPPVGAKWGLYTNTSRSTTEGDIWPHYCDQCPL